jgi:hypothetical protein
LICRAAAHFLGCVASLAAAPASLAAPDGPLHAVSSPSPGAHLSLSLDTGLLRRGDRVQLTVELKNEGSSQMLVSEGDRCNPVLQLAIWNKNGDLQWAPGLPACQPMEENATSVALPAGGSISAEECFVFATEEGHSAKGCEQLDLPFGSYRVGGGFHGLPLPQLELVLGP